MVYRFVAVDSGRRVTNYDYIFFYHFLDVVPPPPAAERDVTVYLELNWAVLGVLDSPRGVSVTDGKAKTGN